MKPIREPGPDHPITITPNPRRVTVATPDRTLADTTASLTLVEASYPPVRYVPRDDADLGALTRSSHTTYCPYKGDCAYFDIPALGERGRNAVWTYEAPYPAVAAIRGHLAFYPDRVRIDESADGAADPA